MHLSTVVNGVGNFTNCTTFNTTLSNLNATNLNTTLGSLLNSTLSNVLNSTILNSTSNNNITITVNINDLSSRSRIFTRDDFVDANPAAKIADNRKFLGKVVGGNAAFTAIILAIVILAMYIKDVRPRRFARKYVDGTRLPVYSMEAPVLTALKSPRSLSPWGLRAYFSKKNGGVTNKVRVWFGKASRAQNANADSDAIELPELPPPRYSSEDVQRVESSYQEQQEDAADADLGDQPPTFDNHLFDSHIHSGFTTLYNNPYSGFVHYHV